MKTYLVGGAVRDKCLGLPQKEMDWVVVGATTEQMLAAGFNKVGKDFPVFLHPDTKEEYALARTERKSGKGYYGFEVFAKPDVTLEEDLLRRDLTINAMAEDQDGHIIDPYGGQSDCQERILRHVSPAFVEDPLRVVRLARFKARFHSLGFRLANETRQLLCEMVRKNELSELVAERVWQEWQRSLTEKNPQEFILLLRECGALQQLLPELDALFGVPNPPQHHPEIDSGVHTLLVLQAACQLSDSPQIRFAALLHDLGKAKTPMSQWPKHLHHESTGIPLILNLCQRLKVPASYRDLALLVCEHHLTIHRYAQLRPATRIKLLEKIDAFRRPERFDQLLLVCQADAMGADYKGVYPQYQQWRYLLAECDKIQVNSILEQGFSGSEVKEELRSRRIVCAKLIDNIQDNHEK